MTHNTRLAFLLGLLIFFFAACEKSNNDPASPSDPSRQLSKLEIEQDQYPFLQQPPKVTVDTFTYNGDRISSIQRIARVPFSPSESYTWVYSYEPGRILASTPNAPTRRYITIDPVTGYMLKDSTDPKIASSLLDTVLYFIHTCSYGSNGFIETDLNKYKRIQNTFFERMILSVDHMKTYTNDGTNLTTITEMITQKDSTFSSATGSLINARISIIRTRTVISYGNEESSSLPVTSPFVFGKASKKLPVREDVTYEVSNDGGLSFVPSTRIERKEFSYEFNADRLVRIREKLIDIPEKRTNFFYR